MKKGLDLSRKGDHEMEKAKNIIEIKNLHKSFGEVHAVNDLSFCVKEGELFAFLGINGAGKSTTIDIICGQLAKDRGEVYIKGKTHKEDRDSIKRSIGVVFQDSVLDKDLSVRDNLQSRAALYGITGKKFEKRVSKLAELLDFSDLMKRTVGKLSGGQRRRIDVARALLHKPEILILDEPTTGLDPKTRSLLWQVIDDLRRRENLTVFLTTHYMEEAADADYVIILDKGRIAAQGTPLSLKNEYAGDYITLYGVSEEEVHMLGAPYEEVRDGFKLSVSDTAAATRMILKHPEIFQDYEIIKGKMDDVFLAATGKKLTGGIEK